MVGLQSIPSNLNAIYGNQLCLWLEKTIFVIFMAN